MKEKAPLPFSGAYFLETITKGKQGVKRYVKQKVFSFRDSFTVKDEEGADCYTVVGDFFSFPKALHIYDSAGAEVLKISRKLLTFLPRYQIFREDKLAAEIAKEFSFFTPKYYIDGAPFTIEGDFLSHNYEVLRDGVTVAKIGKEWFTWGDSYVIDMNPSEDELIMLSILIVIDCVLSSD